MSLFQNMPRDRVRLTIMVESIYGQQQMVRDVPFDFYSGVFVNSDGTVSLTGDPLKEKKPVSPPSAEEEIPF